MAEQPSFVRFVSCVEGRLCPRFGAPRRKYFGVHFSTPEELAAGADKFQFRPKHIQGLDDAYCRKYARELEEALRNGDLIERSRADFDAFVNARAEARAAREDAREKAAQAAADDAKKAEDAKAAAAEAEAKKAAKAAEQAAKAAAATSSTTDGNKS